MTSHRRHWLRAAGCTALLAACGFSSISSTFAQTAAYSPVAVEHKLGKTVISRQPQRVAALEMNEVDMLDQLGVPIAGMVKDFVPHFLAKYKNDAKVADLGAIVQPNLERVHALKPDLILITPLQANHYQELSDIAPTVHFDIDFKNSQSGHFDNVKQHLLTLGRIFHKDALARDKGAAGTQHHSKPPGARTHRAAQQRCFQLVRRAISLRFCLQLPGRQASKRGGRGRAARTACIQ